MTYIKSTPHQGTKYMLDLGNYVIHIGLITHKSSSQNNLVQRQDGTLGFTLIVTEYWCSSFMSALTRLILRTIYYISCSLSEHTKFFSHLFSPTVFILNLWDYSVSSRGKTMNNFDIHYLFIPTLFLMFSLLSHILNCIYKLAEFVLLSELSNFYLHYRSVKSRGSP